MHHAATHEQPSLRVNADELVDAIETNAVNPTVTLTVIVRESLYDGTATAEIVTETETGLVSTATAHSNGTRRHTIEPCAFLTTTDTDTGTGTDIETGRDNKSRIAEFLANPPKRRDIRAQVNTNDTDTITKHHANARETWRRTARNHLANTITINNTAFTVTDTSTGDEP